MNKKLFRESIIQDSLSKDEENRTITFVASNETLNRHGHIVKANWDLKNFKNNAVIFWNHQSEGLPIGVADKVWVDGSKLMAKIRFAEADVNPMADSIYKLYNAGMLKAVSAGYTTDMDTVEIVEKKKIKCLQLNGPHELLEISACGLPSNPQALKQSIVLQNAIKDGVIDELELNDLVINLEKYKEEELEVVEDSSDKEKEEEPVEKIEQTIKDSSDAYEYIFQAFNEIKADSANEGNKLEEQLIQELKKEFNKKRTLDNVLDEILK
jgi:HK97 family phage prohead protease